MTEQVEDFLEHFGVKGMRWGHRKAREDAPPKLSRRERRAEADRKDVEILEARARTAKQRERTVAAARELAVTDMGLTARFNMENAQGRPNSAERELWVTKQPEYKAAVRRFETAKKTYMNNKDYKLAETVTNKEVRDAKTNIGIALGIYGAVSIAYVALVAKGR